MSSNSEKSIFPPLQFNFLAHWQSDLQLVLSRPLVEHALEELKEKYIEMMRDLYEMGELGSGVAAQKRLLSEIFKVEADYREYHWLRETWEPSDLIELTLAIARELYPQEQFEIVESADIHSVVTNQSRTMVFDLRLHDRLSAWESLLLAGELTESTRNAPQDRLQAYLQERLDRQQEILNRSNEHLKKIEELTAAKNPIPLRPCQ